MTNSPQMLERLAQSEIQDTKLDNLAIVLTGIISFTYIDPTSGPFTTDDTARYLLIGVECLTIHKAISTCRFERVSWHCKTSIPQTAINWVTRLSIARIQYATELQGSPPAGDIFSNGFVLLIDVAVGFGTGKILAVLALNVQHHARQQTTPSFSDVQCIAVSVATSWTGELVAEFLENVIGVMGRPVAFLNKDSALVFATCRRAASQSNTSIVVLPLRSSANGF